MLSSHGPTANLLADRGLGTEVLRWMCEYVFATLGYRRIELSADATNARALRCYAKVGFVEEGRRRKRYWCEGEWRDVLEMAMLEEEWFGDHRQRDAAQWSVIVSVMTKIFLPFHTTH